MRPTGIAEVSMVQSRLGALWFIGIAIVHGQLLRDGGLGKSDGGTRQPRHLSLMNPANLFLGATFNLLYGINKPLVTKITTAATAVMLQNMIIRGHSPSF